MLHDPQLGSGLTYIPCRYGTSRMLFRGPKKPLDGQHIAFIGGSQTYGRFLHSPFPALVEDQLGITCVNFGQMNASVDAFLHDPTVLSACRDAAYTVIEITGAANLSNRFYSVHPRRNDRFVAASSVMSALYPEVDFTEVCFTRAMLRRVHDVAPARFPIVREEIQNAWCARMRSLIEAIGPRVILLWMAPSPPPESVPDDADHWLGTEPLFVTRAMIDRLRLHVRSVLTVLPSAKRHHAEGLLVDEADQAAAAQMVGPAVHAKAAGSIVAIVQALGGVAPVAAVA